MRENETEPERLFESDPGRSCENLRVARDHVAAQTNENVNLGFLTPTSFMFNALEVKYARETNTYKSKNAKFQRGVKRDSCCT